MRTNRLQWNSLYCNESIEKKHHYLKYKIKIRCKNLNPVKLSKKQVNLYNKICDLKDKGLTIQGVKKMLNNQKIHSLDDSVALGVYKPDLENSKIIKDKIKKISKIIKELKKYK